MLQQEQGPHTSQMDNIVRLDKHLLTEMGPVTLGPSTETCMSQSQRHYRRTEFAGL